MYGCRDLTQSDSQNYLMNISFSLDVDVNMQCSLLHPHI